VRVRKTVLRVLTALTLLACAAASHAAAGAEGAGDWAQQHQRGLLALQRGDVAAAMAALRGPAQAGHAASQSLLAFILDRADFTAEAARLWRDAAAKGDAEAHAGLGALYQSGRGVAKDEKRALWHFSEAAARGHAAATELVALAWLQGQLGADAAAEPAAARAALLRAAEQGHLASADALSGGYRTGRFGLPVDEAQAQAWQTRAAQWRQQRAAAPAKATP
jgi:uncharacterized protein